MHPARFRRVDRLGNAPPLGQRRARTPGGVRWHLLAALLAIAATAEVHGAEDPDTIDVLIVTGIDHPAHDWKTTTPVLVNELSKDPRMRVDVLRDPYQLDAADLSHRDVVVLHFMNWEKPDPSDRAKEKLKRFVEQGGGLVSIHFACGAFRAWKEFPAILGRVYDGVNTHDPRGPFTVDVINRDHPVTRAMPAAFETDDELYICLTGDRPIDLLATARSKVTGRDHPMAFAHRYGQGRVFLTTLGHDAKALRAAGTAELIRRGVAWASGRSPLGNDAGPVRTGRVPTEDSAGQYTLTAGFRIEPVAMEPDILNPMSMCVDEHGTLWVTEAHSYRWGAEGSPFQPPTNPIKRIELGDDGQAARTTVVAQGFSNPVIGLDVCEGKLYATCLNELFVMDILPDGSLTNRKLLVRDAAEPWNPFGMYRVRVGPDGNLWLAIADHPSGEPVVLTGSDGRTVRLNGQSGGMVRCRRDGSGLEVVVEGLRAPYAFDFDPWGHLWQVTNGEGSPNLLVDVIFGMDYGFASRNASYAWLAGQELLSPPVHDVGPGANTAVLQYYSSMFPPGNWGSMLVSNWGSHGENPTNRNIRRYLQRRGASDRTSTRDAELVEVEMFLTTRDPKFRPTGLAMAPDGGVFLLDWHGRDDENDLTGRILKIVWTRPSQALPEAEGTAESSTLHTSVSRDGASPEASTAESLERCIVQLGHRNHFVRDEARRILALAGDRCVDALAEMAERGEPLAAANAVWTLTRMNSESAAQGLAGGLKHTDPRVRGHVLRQLRQAAGQTLAGDFDPDKRPLIAAVDVAEMVRPLFADRNAEVRVEAALAQDSPEGVIRGLLAALEAGPDKRLQYQIGLQLGRRGEAKKVLELARSTDAVRHRVGMIAIDTARYERTPLLQAIADQDASVLEELPPASFQDKLAWLRRSRPELLSGEIARLETGEIQLSNVNDVVAALACLETCPQDATPVGFLESGLKHADPRIQRAALRAVSRRKTAGDELLAPTLRLIEPSGPDDVRIEAIYALGTFGSAVATDVWTDCLKSPSRDIVAAALRSLRQVESESSLASAILGAAPELAARLPELGQDLRLTLRRLGFDDATFGRLGLNGEPKNRQELEAAILTRLPVASAALGRLSFYSSTVGCFQCHSMDHGASTLGPSLAEIGKVSQPEYLVESMVEPSKVIKSGFLCESITMRDGRVVTGLVEARGNELTVTQGPGERISVPIADVERRTASPASFMPEEMGSVMSPSEMADVAAWLLAQGTTP